MGTMYPQGGLGHYAPQGGATPTALQPYPVPWQCSRVNVARSSPQEHDDAQGEEVTVALALDVHDEQCSHRHLEGGARGGRQK